MYRLHTNFFIISNLIFKMYLSANAAILLLALFLTGVLAQFSDIEDNAQTEARYNCKCVKYYNCKNGSVDIYGTSIFRPRAGAPIPCKGGDKDIPNDVICCKLNGNSATPTVTDRGPTDQVKPALETSCGKMKTSLIPRVHTTSDDLDAIDGEFPWIVAIFNSTSFICGGTLIHPKAVLTANHCVYRKRPTELTVRANGKIDLPNEQTSRRYVSEIIGHPRYVHTGRLYNDAALVILETPFNENDISTLCMPPQSVDLEGKRCIVAGWGQDNQGQNRDKLKRVELPFVSHSRCNTLMKSSRLGRNFNLHSSFMCAGGEEGKDACIGDGGGALVCEMPADPNQFFQAGIVAWGIGCGLRDVPGVYTDTAKISEWIKDELRKKNLNF